MKEQLDENYEIERNNRRNRRMEEMRRRKEKQDIARRRIRIVVPIAAVVLVLAIVMVSGIGRKGSGKGEAGEIGQKEGNEIAAVSQEMGKEEGGTQETSGEESKNLLDNFLFQEGQEEEKEEEKPLYYAEETENTLQLGGDILSSYAVLIDMENKAIVSGKSARVRMNPASMTKVLTLLVAAEHIENLDDRVEITLEMTDYSFVNGCSNAGFERGETVTVRDLMYGTILPSGAEAAVGLSIYVAGSQEAFVEMMNGKLEELGLSGSAHFTNCVGVYDENHYCTAYDMAMIMEAALDNEVCREVLSSRTYTTSETEEHPEGMILSNWFLRRIEDKEVGGKVTSGKTGFVKESGSCAVSYGMDKDGKGYVCVTADAESQWTCIKDHAKLYQSVMMQ